MLQAIHDKITGWVAGIVIGVIALVFIFWGIDVGFSTVSYAAKVNGEEIDPAEVRRVFQDQLNQYQQFTRGEVPAEMRLQLGNNVLDEFIRVEVLAQQANEQGYRISDAEVLKAYERIPQFQVGGAFDREAAKRILAGEGMSPAQFEAQQRRFLTMGQLQGGIASSTFVTPAELERVRKLEGEEREVAWAVIPAAAQMAAAEPDEAAIKAYYEQNKAKYRTADTVDLRYVELKVADVSREVQVTEDALRGYYEGVKDRYTEEEKRRGRHILFNVGNDSEDAAARKKADDAMARAKRGEDFARLAQELSQDAGSAAQGGDLGWAERSFFVGPFADALFSMNKGEIRGPVRTQFGYHVLRLDDIQAGRQKSFDEARAEIENEYRAAEAEKLFGQRQEELAAKAFENIDSLDPAAQDLGLTVRSAANFTRDGAASPWGARPEIIEAAFSEAVLGGQNSEPVELEPGHLVVLRAENRRPPQEKPLAAVRGEILAQLRTDKARELAREAGKAARAKLEAGGEWQAVVADAQAKSEGPKFIGRTDESVPGELRQALFAAPKPAAGAKQFGTAALANGDVAVFAFSATRQPATQETAEQREARARQAANRVAQSEVGGYLAELLRKADIDRNPAIFQ
jgi:peptidyl-prolyl cis-trans isomerase D